MADIELAGFETDCDPVAGLADERARRRTAASSRTSKIKHCCVYGGVPA